MARSIRSFNERMAVKARADALESISMTERLLALVLMELMELRGHRGYAELATRLQGAGFSRVQSAAILNTTPASLFVLEQRRESTTTANAVAGSSE